MIAYMPNPANKPKVFLLRMRDGTGFAPTGANEPNAIVAYLTMDEARKGRMHRKNLCRVDAVAVAASAPIYLLQSDDKSGFVTSEYGADDELQAYLNESEALEACKYYNDPKNGAEFASPIQAFLVEP